MGKLLAGLATGLLLAGCTPPELRGARAHIEPAYIFALGVHQDDVMAMLGWPNEGPRFDRLTQYTQLV